MSNEAIFGLLPAEFSGNSPILSKEMLKEKLLEMLREDSGKLINILYRIDISESKLSRAFEAKIDTKIAAEIATLVVERLMQKQETRKKYGEI